LGLLLVFTARARHFYAFGFGRQVSARTPPTIPRTAPITKPPIPTKLIIENTNTTIPYILLCDGTQIFKNKMNLCSARMLVPKLV